MFHFMVEIEELIFFCEFCLCFVIKIRAKTSEGKTGAKMVTRKSNRPEVLLIQEVSCRKLRRCYVTFCYT